MASFASTMPDCDTACQAKLAKALLGQFMADCNGGCGNDVRSSIVASRLDAAVRALEDVLPGPMAASIRLSRNLAVYCKLRYDSNRCKSAVDDISRARAQQMSVAKKGAISPEDAQNLIERSMDKARASLERLQNMEDASASHVAEAAMDVIRAMSIDNGQAN